MQKSRMALYHKKNKIIFKKWQLRFLSGVSLLAASVLLTDSLFNDNSLSWWRGGLGFALWTLACVLLIASTSDTKK